VADAPKEEEEVHVLLALSDLYNRPLIKGRVAEIRGIVLEEFLLPVIVAISLLKQIIVRDGDVLGALHFRVLVTIVVNDMATTMHHLTELQSLLCECAGTIVFPCNGVWHTQNVESERWLRRGL